MTTKFKVGDKVKILSKSYPYYEDQQWLNDRFPNRKGIINNIHVKGSMLETKFHDIFVIEGFFFIEEDLELIKEGEEKMEKPKYEIVKPITAKELMIAQGSTNCSEFQDALLEFIGNFGTKGTVKDFNRIEAKVKPQHIKWLEQKGFIKKKKEEVFYKVGDIFKRNNTKTEEYYMITYYYKGNGVYKAFLCQISEGYRGNRYTEPIEIKDSEKITQEEFERICGTGTFTLVKNTTINVVI